MSNEICFIQTELISLLPNECLDFAQDTPTLLPSPYCFQWGRPGHTTMQINRWSGVERRQCNEPGSIPVFIRLVLATKLCFTLIQDIFLAALAKNVDMVVQVKERQA